MRVLMLGWEFPPFISGGLGTACYGLTRAMSEMGIEVLFVLPRAVSALDGSHVTLVSPAQVELGGTEGAAAAQAAGGSERAADGFANVTFRRVDALLLPYAQPAEDDAGPALAAAARGAASLTYRIARPSGAGASGPAAVTARVSSQAVAGAQQPTEGFIGGPGANYAGDLFAEVERYAWLVRQIAAVEAFDVIHAHDWMTYPAGIAAAQVSGKPLVVHVHSTEFDRSGLNVNRRIYDIERRGVHAADRVIAVSFLTRNILTSRYAAPAERVTVVHNAIDMNGPGNGPLPPPIRRDEKIVLFLGRVTMQKGPEYFLAAARKVLSVMENVRFVMAGSGDMIRRMIELAAEMGIGHKVLFTGFLRGDDVARVFKMADLYVMPSVSEPFGIAPLEAMSHDVPVIISKQSGVAEVLTHVLKVDFWDIDEMANKIVAVLRHPPLHTTLREHGSFEVSRLTWRDSAEKCREVYEAAAAHRR